MVDLSTFLYGPIYRTRGRAATITLADTDATEIAVTAIYTNSGRNLGGEQIGVRTVEASASLMKSDLASLSDLADLYGATITFDFGDVSEQWTINEWVAAPGRAGEAAGEIRLILTGGIEVVDGAETGTGTGTAGTDIGTDAGTDGGVPANAYEPIAGGAYEPLGGGYYTGI